MPANIESYCVTMRSIAVNLFDIHGLGDYIIFKLLEIKTTDLPNLWG